MPWILGRRVELDVILEDSGVICSADRLQPAPCFSYLPRRTVNVVQFRELAMVLLSLKVYYDVSGLLETLFST